MSYLSSSFSLPILSPHHVLQIWDASLFSQFVTSLLVSFSSQLSPFGHGHSLPITKTTLLVFPLPAPLMDQASQRSASAPLPDGWAQLENFSQTPHMGRTTHAKSLSRLSSSQCPAILLEFSDQSHPSFS